jgi:hypothetical protein
VNAEKPGSFLFSPHSIFLFDWKLTETNVGSQTSVDCGKCTSISRIEVLIYLALFLYFTSWGSPVNIVSDYGPDDRASGFDPQQRRKDFFL